MSSSKEKDTMGTNNDNNTPPVNICVRIERNRLEAERRRNASQVEATNTLERLLHQQQHQINRLQDHAAYERLQCANLTSTQTHASRDASSSYAATFNPGPLDEMGVPYARFPVSKQYSRMIKAFQNGTVTPHMVEQVMSEIKDNDNTSIESPTVIITPINDSIIDDPNIVSVSPNQKNNTIPDVALLPFLGSKRHCPSGDYAMHSMVETPSASDSCIILNTHTAEVVDLTGNPIEANNEPPKKQYKHTTVELTVSVTMPGLSHPFVKTIHCNNAFNESKHASEN